MSVGGLKPVSRNYDGGETGSSLYFAASEGISVSRVQRLLLEYLQTDIKHIEISRVVAMAFDRFRERDDSL